MKIFIAIDPGISGAIAVLNEDSTLNALYDTPVYKTGVKNQREVDAIELYNILKNYTMEVVVLEKVHSMPGQGTTSSFNFGVNLGILKGVVGSLGLTPIMCTPQKWKKHFNLIGKPKDDARILAKSLFPSASLERKKDVDRADALLMCLWFIKNNKTEGTI